MLPLEGLIETKLSNELQPGEFFWIPETRDMCFAVAFGPEGSETTFFLCLQPHNGDLTRLTDLPPAAPFPVYSIPDAFVGVEDLNIRHLEAMPESGKVGSIYQHGTELYFAALVGRQRVKFNVRTGRSATGDGPERGTAIFPRWGIYVDGRHKVYAVFEFDGDKSK